MVVAAAGFAAFLALAAAFWIGTNTNSGRASEPGWASALGEAGSWKVLPLLVLVIGATLFVRGHAPEARFLVIAVLERDSMYCARIVLQVLGADDDGGVCRTSRVAMRRPRPHSSGR